MAEKEEILWGDAKHNYLFVVVILAALAIFIIFITQGADLEKAQKIGYDAYFNTLLLLGLGYFIPLLCIGMGIPYLLAKPLKITKTGVSIGNTYYTLKAKPSSIEMMLNVFFWEFKQPLFIPWEQIKNTGIEEMEFLVSQGRNSFEKKPQCYARIETNEGKTYWIGLGITPASKTTLQKLLKNKGNPDSK